MKSKKAVYLCVIALSVAAVIAACAMQSSDAPGSGAAIRIDGDDIGGVVTSAKGPEAGVWVIAETTELPTRFSRSVVTNDQGRYVLPDLPKVTRAFQFEFSMRSCNERRIHGRKIDH